MPYYLLCTRGFGWTVDDINKSCPAELKPYERAKKLEKDEIDDELWAQGLYFYHACSTALAEFGSGLAGKHSNAKYLDKSLTRIAEEEKLNNEGSRIEYKYMSEEDIEKAELEKAKTYFNSFGNRFNASKGIVK